ncbi:MAG: PD-(D/E)XK nuclease family protein, partial [Muribaculum sp.]|nr:PD-(D/E)XK nuclease family protein [Muribaculum sp.]
TLNKTYVAFTRAVRELIIGYNPSAQSPKEVIEAIRRPESEYIAMSTTVNNFSEDTAPLLAPYIDTDGVFTFGEPTTPLQPKPETQAKLMPPYVSYSNPEIWRLNSLDGLEDIITARHEGIVLHDIMAGIRHVADVPRAVRQSAMRGYLDPSRCDELIRAITAAISADNTIRWFEGYERVVIERAFINADRTEYFKKSGKAVPHSRPDRIVWLPDGSIEIIDYKFGDERSTYTTQVRDYMHYVAECYPDATAVRGYLWHPLTGEMRLVSMK